MKYKIDNEKNLQMFPESSMDLFNLGTVWAKCGGKILFTSDTDKPQREIEFYELEIEQIIHFLIKIAP